MRYAGFSLIEAGATGGATMQQVELSVSFLLPATWSPTSPGTLPQDIAHTVVGHRHDAV